MYISISIRNTHTPHYSLYYRFIFEKTKKKKKTKKKITPPDNARENNDDDWGVRARGRAPPAFG